MIGRTFALLFCSLLFGAAQAQTYTNLLSFCGQSACADGASPQAGLVADTAGNLYGVTIAGGPSNNGVAFELSPDGGGGWTHSVLYQFCAQTACRDGAQPTGPLIVDADGNLYGTTTLGGRQNAGVAFKLTPHAGLWQLTVMHAFCKQASCLDGNRPSGALAYLGQRSGAAYDGTSPLYGTAAFGGVYNKGVVYSLSPPPPGGRSWWKTKTLYSFCAEGGICPQTGHEPFSGVIVHSRTVLYGTTLFGGLQDAGTAFQLTHAGAWQHQLVYGFCAQGRCADGRNPTTLVENDAGDLFGTTINGPHRTGCVKKSCGTVFMLLHNTGILTTLHTFCSDMDCADGRGPGPLAMLGNGDLVGIAQGGGNLTNHGFGGGVLYRLSGTTETVLHDFCSDAGCSDGAAPMGAVVVDPLGRMFGTANQGGDAGRGVVWELAP